MPGSTRTAVPSPPIGMHVIQERLGHASIKTTLDTYGHLLEGLDEAAADRLEVTYFANPASRQEAASLAAVSSE